MENDNGNTGNNDEDNTGCRVNDKGNNNDNNIAGSKDDDDSNKY